MNLRNRWDDLGRRRQVDPAGASSTFAVSATLDRAIVGGTGKYRGATGWVESTHNADGSWTHVFHLT